MNIFQYRKSFVKVFVLFLTGLFSLLLNTAQAQFTITENFRGQVGPDIIIGDDARLTSGNIDPVGAGWLRLTPDENSKQGYAYINRTFPSTLGVLADFEYKMYRNNTSDGADGISVFLFDGTYGPGTFKLGRYGGALGYGPGGSANGPQDGLSGGYVGIALDAFGNFSTTNHGGPAGGVGSPSAVQAANSITMRGKTTANRTTSNPLLARKELTGTNLIDYNTKTSTRPGDNVFYRRVQVEMVPIEGKKGFLIKLRWKTTPNGAFEDLVAYTYNEAPPELLKIGFGASTGGYNNVHEIRNLVVTTPGNLRVSKLANKDVLRAGTSGIDREITYTVEVNNDTDANLTGVDFKDRLTDGAGDLVKSDMFQITGISHSGFLLGTTLPTSSSTNELSGSLNIAPNTVGKITVTGRLLKVPVGNILVNTATALPTDITDQDLENNTSEVRTPVIAENVDLILQKRTIGNPCIDYTNGNSFELRVANMGSVAATYRRLGTKNKNRIVVTKDIPTGYTYNDIGTSTNRWDKRTESISGGIRYVYVARGVEDKDQTLNENGSVMEPDYPIKYTIKPPSGVSSYEDKSTVQYISASGSNSYTGTDIEPESNRANNTITETIYATPPVPKLTKSIVYYCQGEIATALQATVTNPSYKVVWYSSLGGVPLNNAPTPITITVGTTIYYVSQTNGSCESPQVEVKVIVLATPIGGTISGDQTVCGGTAPQKIKSTAAGTAPDWPAGTSVTYRWEKLSPVAGANWETIASATATEYTPVAENTVGLWKYRRVTIPVFSGKQPACEAISKEVSITVKNCLIISNPMLRSRARK